jgi:hypothetical protein
MNNGINNRYLPKIGDRVLVKIGKKNPRWVLCHVSDVKPRGDTHQIHYRTADGVDRNLGFESWYPSRVKPADAHTMDGASAPGHLADVRRAPIGGVGAVASMRKRVFIHPQVGMMLEAISGRTDRQAGGLVEVIGVKKDADSERFHIRHKSSGRKTWKKLEYFHDRAYRVVSPDGASSVHSTASALDDVARRHGFSAEAVERFLATVRAIADSDKNGSELDAATRRANHVGAGVGRSVAASTAQLGLLDGHR